MAGRATLYAIPNSHPCWTAEEALRLKRIPYRRVDIAPLYHQLAQRARFGRPTVPGLRLADGEKVAGSREIVHRLEQIQPEPPLLPDRHRAQIEEAERWGDEVLQAAMRRIEVFAFTRSPADVLMPAATGTRMLGLPVPRFWVRINVGPGAWISARVYGASEERVRADLDALPGHLDRVDGWIADGLVGGESPNAADLQLASSLRVVAAMGDLRPLIEGRPCLALAELVSNWKAPVPAGTLPAAWLPAA